MSVDVSSLIRAWSRTLVPAALVAAAVAGLWLAAENGPPGERSVTVEEYLPEAAGGIPAVFLSGEAPDATEVLAVSEAY